LLNYDCIIIITRASIFVNRWVRGAPRENL
jgi:hypothetical protein